MLLTIDCGNTNTVFGIWDRDKFLAIWRTSTDQRRTADEYHVWLSSLMRYAELNVTIDEVIISSTVPRVVFNLRVLSNRYFKTRPLVVGKPECLLPIEARVDPGTQVGSDRLVNTVAAFDLHGGDLIVVDFGTATTFDVVDIDGAYIGGVIAPGVNLSLTALHQAAAQLPNIDVSRPKNVIGKNTVDCMQSGVFWGYVGLVNGVVDQIRQEHGRPMKVVATGGLAPLFQQGQAKFDVFEEMLIMHGLTVIYEYNQGHTA